MGRTLPSAMQVFDAEAARWAKFRRALLEPEDREILDRLFLAARRHVAAMSYAAPDVPMEALLLAMLLETGRALDAAEARLARLEAEGAGADRRMAA